MPLSDYKPSRSATFQLVSAVGVVLAVVAIPVLLLSFGSVEDGSSTRSITLPPGAWMECAKNLSTAVKARYDRVLEEAFAPTYGRRPLRLTAVVCFHPHGVCKSVVLAQRSLFATMSDATCRWAHRLSFGLFALNPTSFRIDVDVSDLFMRTCVPGGNNSLALAYAVHRFPRELGWKSPIDLAPIACVPRGLTLVTEREFACLCVSSLPRFSIEVTDADEDDGVKWMWSMSALLGLAAGVSVLTLWDLALGVLRSQSIDFVKGENDTTKSLSVRFRTGLRLCHALVPFLALYPSVLCKEPLWVRIGFVVLCGVLIVVVFFRGVTESSVVGRCVLAGMAVNVGLALAWVALGLYFHPVQVGLRISIVLSLSAYVASLVSSLAALDFPWEFTSVVGVNANIAFRECFSDPKLRADFASRRFLRGAERELFMAVGNLDIDAELYKFLTRSEDPTSSSTSSQSSSSSSVAPSSTSVVGRSSYHSTSSMEASYSSSSESSDASTVSVSSSPPSDASESTSAPTYPSASAQTRTSASPATTSAETAARTDLDDVRVALLPEIIGKKSEQRGSSSSGSRRSEKWQDIDVFGKFLFRSLVAEFFGGYARMGQNGAEGVKALEDITKSKDSAESWREKLDAAYARAERKSKQRFYATVLGKLGELILFVATVFFVAPAVLDHLVPDGLVDNAEQIVLFAGLVAWRLWIAGDEEVVDVVAEMEALLEYGVDPRTTVAMNVGNERKSVSIWELLAARAAACKSDGNEDGEWWRDGGNWVKKGGVLASKNEVERMKRREGAQALAKRVAKLYDG